MLERTLLVAVIVLLVIAMRWYIQWRQQRHQGQLLNHVDLPLGKPAIIALTTSHCMQCERLQKPALQRLQAKRNDVTVLWRNVADEPDLVKQYGIMTVPSTVVRGANGELRHINLGYTDEQTLLQQIA
jgi:thioredoxin 1